MGFVDCGVSEGEEVVVVVVVEEEEVEEVVDTEAETITSEP